MVLVTHALALAVVGAAVAVLARLLLDYVHFRKLELAIPGPPSLPLLGNMLDFARVTPDTALSTVLRLTKGRGPLSRWSIGGHLVAVVSTPEAIEQVVRRAEFNHKSNFFYDLMDLPRGLVQLGGPDWKARRRALEPGFNKQVLDRFVEVFNQEAKTLVADLPVDQPVDVVRPLRLALARNFIRTSISADTLEIEKEALPFLEFLESVVRSLNQRMFSPLLRSDLVFQLTPFGRTFAAQKAAVEEIIRKALTLKQGECREEQPGVRRNFADILIDLYDRREIPEKDVLDEVRTFFGANIETSSSSLSWALKILSIYPEVQERLYDEVVAVLGDREITARDLPELKYMERVLKEVMRMFPAIPVVSRQCPRTREVELCGYKVPAGSSLFINILAAHRDPGHWQDPDRFDPDRFLAERSRGRHQCAFMPFSSGARNCIGGRYAMVSMTTILAVTIRAFRVLSVDDHRDLRSLTDNMAFDLSSRLVGGTRVRFQPRGPVGAPEASPVKR